EVHALLGPLQREDLQPRLDQPEHAVAEPAQRPAEPRPAAGLPGFAHRRAQRRAMRTPTSTPAAAAIPTAPHGCSCTYLSVVFAASPIRSRTSASSLSSLAFATRSDSCTRARAALARSPSSPAVALSSSSESETTAFRSDSSCSRATLVASLTT